MSATVTKAGPYYTSGSISFSSLRQNFRAQQPGGTFVSDTAEIRASELRKNVNKNASNPIVPQATENANISSSTNLKLSQFRNSIKYYYITQTGTDANTATSTTPAFNITTQTWNSNLNQNIRKFLYINGIIGSNTTSQYAAKLDAEVYNLLIDISGQIYGAGGANGTLASVSGKPGGSALYVNSTGSQVIVNLRTGAKVYGGGGGGEKGATGPAGDSSVCYSYSYYNTGNACGSCPGCDGYTSSFDGLYYSDSSSSCNSAGGCDCWSNKGGSGCNNTAYYSTCQRTTPYAVNGAPGGEGGDGGLGQGYNQTKTNGSLGVDGTAGGCPDYGGTGSKGEPGGNGGNWGADGKGTDNTGSGGTAGRAITGSNYDVQGNFPLGEDGNATLAGLYSI